MLGMIMITDSMVIFFEAFPYKNVEHYGKLTSFGAKGYKPKNHLCKRKEEEKNKENND